MKTFTNKRPQIAAVTLALGCLLVVGGCEDSVLTAPNDGTMIITANPATVTIDPNQGETMGTASVVAQLFDANGRPLSGVSILFSTSGGSLASNNTPVVTNDSGIATDTITITTNSPQESTVVAQSSSISAAVAVFRDIVGVNETPLALVVTSPPSVGAAVTVQASDVVQFDGTASTDPDGNIECFQWEIDSNLGNCAVAATQLCSADSDCPGSDVCINRTARDELQQGTGLDLITETFDNEQVAQVALRVSDDPAIGAICNAADPPISPGLFNGTSSSVTVTVACNNDPPVANLGNDFTISTVQGGFNLDASGSFDNETLAQDLNFEFQCNTGFGPQGGIPRTDVLPLGSGVFCQFSVISDSEFEPEVVVTDRGTGVLLSNGTFECQKSVSDSITVTVDVP